MPTIYRLIAATVLVMLVGIAPASAWRSYAECGLNESQVMTASSGKAVPCRQDAPVCATTPNGNQPALPELPAADLEGALGDAKLPCFTLGMSDRRSAPIFAPA